MKFFKSKIMATLLSIAMFCTAIVFGIYSAQNTSVLTSGSIIYSAPVETTVSSSASGTAGSLTLSSATASSIGNIKITGNSVQSKLPSAYQEVEYIENSGTQCIDTGIIPNSSTGVDITYQTNNYQKGLSQYILGSRVDTTAQVAYALNGSSGTNTWDVRFNGLITESTMTRTNNKINSVITLSSGTGTWKLTNLDTGATETKTLSSKSVTATANLFLFSYNKLQGNIHSGLIIYQCKIYAGTTLIRDFVPCYRISDNVIGLYDIVNDVFYTNAGTGTFTKGENVPNPSTPQEIQSVGERTKNLFDISQAENGTLASANGTNLGVEQYPNRCRSGFIYLFAGNYTISFNQLISTGSYLHTYSSNNQNSWQKSITFSKSGSVSKFTLDSSCFVRFTIQPIDTSGSLELNTNTLVNYLPQLEQGSTATEYEPYGYKIPINLNGATHNVYLDEPLRAIGEVSDELNIAENGTITVTRKIASEYITTVTNVSSLPGTYKKVLSSISYVPLLDGKSVSSKGFAISNKFQQSSYTYNDLSSHGNMIQTYITDGGDNIIVYTFDDSSITTKELAQEKIGEGFEACYVMATNITTTLTQTLSLSTVAGDNTLSINTTIVPTDISVTYIKV